MTTALVDLVVKLVAILAVASVLFFSGVAWEKRKGAEQRLAQVTDAFETYKKQVGQSIVESKQKNDALIASILADQSNQDQIKRAALDRLQRNLTAAKEKIRALEAIGVPEPVLVEVCTAGDLYRLDVGTVRLLDAARANLPAPDASSAGDEESGAASAVGANQLIANDLEIVKRYHELAKRHNSLVDYIEQKQREQAK